VLLDRGNFDLILFVLMSSFVFLFKSEKYSLSALMLALVNAIKPFYVLFLILFLFQKKYKEFFLSIIVSAILILLGFSLLHGDFWNQISVFITNIALFNKAFTYDIDAGLSNCSSLFMALKFILFRLMNLSPSYIVNLIKIYNIFSLIMTFVILFFTWKEKIFWKRISLLTFYSLLIPNVVFDYKLIFLFIPLWLFVNAKEKTKFDLVYTILFALLLIPKRFILVWQLGNMFKWPPLSIILNPLIMLIFVWLIIFEQFWTKREITKNIKNQLKQGV